MAPPVVLVSVELEPLEPMMPEFGEVLPLALLEVELPMLPLVVEDGMPPDDVEPEEMDPEDIVPDDMVPDGIMTGVEAPGIADDVPALPPIDPVALVPPAEPETPPVALAPTPPPAADCASSVPGESAIAATMMNLRIVFSSYRYNELSM